MVFLEILLVLIDRVWVHVRMRAFFLEFSMYIITTLQIVLIPFLNLETCCFIFALATSPSVCRAGVVRAGSFVSCWFRGKPECVCSRLPAFGAVPSQGWRTSFPLLMHWMPFLWRDVRFCQTCFCVVVEMIFFFLSFILFVWHIALVYFHLLDSIYVLFMLFLKLQVRNLSYWQSTWLPCTYRVQIPANQGDQDKYLIHWYINVILTIEENLPDMKEIILLEIEQCLYFSA